MIPPSKRAFLLATAGVLLLGCWIAAGIDVPARGLPFEFGRAADVATAGSIARPLERAEAEPVEPRRAASAPTRAPEVASDASVKAREPEPARLRVSAVSPDLLAPVHRIRVRAASRTRVADRSSNPGWNDVELALTPDRYRLLVSADGFEPVELPEVAIGPGELVSIERVRLPPGNARLLGAVTGDLGDPPPRIELLGSGRRPCSLCTADPHPWTLETPCERCGYTARSSRLGIASNGTFAFEGLAGGLYAVRLLDGEDRAIGPPMHVEVPPGGATAVEIPSVARRSVRIEILDPEGRSLAAEWEAWLRAYAAGERMEPRRSRDFECDFESAGTRVARSSFSDPSVVTAGCFSRRALKCGNTIRASSECTTDDRPLEPSESLWPAPLAPVVEPFVVPSGVEANGWVLVEQLPSTELSLRITCGDLHATATIPASTTETRVRAQMVRETSDGR